MSKDFKDLSLLPTLQQALDTMGFSTPTEIQAKTIPMLIEASRLDFHGQAQTGTGKTLAFGLPLLQKINPDLKSVQALIVAPTRELVGQICQSLRQAAQFTNIAIHPIYGGMGMSEQIRVLKNGVHVVVGTPGRLNDHLRRGTLVLKNLDILVLDEADIMLDMGFKEEVDEILVNAPRNRQIWLFSATVKPGIDHIKRNHMVNPVVVSASKQQVGSSATKQFYCVVPMRLRMHALARFIDSVEDFYGFIFCQTKIMTVEVAEHLNKLGYKAGALHGDMSQEQRNRTIKKFRNKEFTTLVATDIAARGIDVTDITHVVNYSLPNDQESYVHRIGRTGRAGKEGVAITFVNKTEQFRVSALQRRFKVAIDPIEVPSEQDMMGIQLKKIEESLATYKIAPAHSASEIETEVNKLLDSYEAADLKVVLSRMIKEKFLKQFENKEQFTNSFSSPSQEYRTGREEYRRGNGGNGRDVNREIGENLKELCMNVGADDGVNKFKVFEYIKTHTTVPQESVAKVRVIKRRTFLIVNSAQVSTLVKDLNGHTLKGRVVRVQMA